MKIGSPDKGLQLLKDKYSKLDNKMISFTNDKETKGLGISQEAINKNRGEIGKLFEEYLEEMYGIIGCELEDKTSDYYERITSQIKNHEIDLMEPKTRKKRKS